MRLVMRERGISVSELARRAQVSRQTIHRALNDSLTQKTAWQVSKALGVYDAWLLVGPPVADPATPDSAPATGGNTAPPRVMAGLPYAVRVWLQEELLAYTKAGVPPDELADARALLESPEVRSFYEGGASRARTEAEVLKGMKGLAHALRLDFRERGYKLEPFSAD